MDRTTKIFKNFVQANRLKAVPDFVAGKIKYEGFGSDPMTQEELVGTMEFTGFVDGYEGHANRYEGPVCHPEVDDEETTKSLEFMYEILKKIGKEPLLEYSGTEKQRYETQYRLGFASNTLNV